MDGGIGFLRTKLRGDEVNLSIDPIGTVAPRFVGDLMETPPGRAPVVFFDTYERTAVVLDRWLRDLVSGTYGNIPVETILVIAGRYELGRGPQGGPTQAGRHPWSDFYPYIERISLEPFGAEEAGEYLRRRGITKPQVVEVILRLSGRLPPLISSRAMPGAGPRRWRTLEQMPATGQHRNGMWHSRTSAVPLPLRRQTLTATSAGPRHTFVWLDHASWRDLSPAAVEVR